MSQQDMVAILESHQKGYNSTSDEVWNRNPICKGCGHAWPCDTAVVIAAHFGASKFCLCDDPDYCLRYSDPLTKVRAIAYRREHGAPLPKDVS